MTINSSNKTLHLLCLLLTVLPRALSPYQTLSLQTLSLQSLSLQTLSLQTLSLWTFSLQTLSLQFLSTISLRICSHKAHSTPLKLTLAPSPVWILRESVGGNGIIIETPINYLILCVLVSSFEESHLLPNEYKISWYSKVDFWWRHLNFYSSFRTSCIFQGFPCFSIDSLLVSILVIYYNYTLQLNPN